MRDRVAVYPAGNVSRESLGALLRSRREAMGWSLRECAEEADVALGYLHRLEAGEVRQPGPVYLARLARALDQKASGLYGDLMRAAGYL